MIAQIDKEIICHLEQHQAITIRQCQAIYYREFNDKDGYTYARRKLRHLEELGLIKSYENALTKHKVYYLNKKLSAHDLFRMDFHAKLVQLGCTIRQYAKTPHFLNGLIVPDAYFFFIKDRLVYFVLLEVDHTHLTDMSKFQMYEMLFQSGELQAMCYGRFPQIVVMGENPLLYQSKHFEVVKLDFSLKDFDKVLKPSR